MKPGFYIGNKTNGDIGCYVFIKGVGSISIKGYQNIQARGDTTMCKELTHFYPTEFFSFRGGW